MKLTELKSSIDAALRLHDDYDVKVNCKELDECRIDPGRFNFNIHSSEFECESYHVEEDTGMEHCNICNVYYSAAEECPSCELKVIKKKIK